jgi:hypothetical protein
VLKLKFVLSIGFSAGNPQRTQSHKTLEKMPIGRKTAIENNCSLFAHFFQRFHLPFLVSELSTPSLLPTLSCCKFIYTIPLVASFSSKMMNQQQDEIVIGNYFKNSNRTTIF